MQSHTYNICDYAYILLCTYIHTYIHRVHTVHTFKSYLHCSSLGADLLLRTVRRCIHSRAVRSPGHDHPHQAHSGLLGVQHRALVGYPTLSMHMYVCLYVHVMYVFYVCI